VGFLVAKTASPVVPAYIKGAREAFPKWAKRPRFLPIKVYIGRPIEFYDRDGNPTADLDGKVDEGDLPFLISQQIMNRIQELKEEIERQ
jgi:1-acyl-sn-glycerol-3-phosphate acyltransferase